MTGTLVRFTAFCAAAVAFSVAQAQSYATRPVTIVNPTAPGGPLDVLARLLQPRLGPLLGQPVIVESKPGAGTYLGGEFVSRAAPDGHTMLINATGGLFPELFVKGLAVQQSKELTPVALVGVAHFFFYGPASLPAKDMKEVVALVKANPKKYNMATFPGALTSLQALNFLNQQGMDMLRVPYNSAANIITAMLRDEVQLYVGSISAAKPQIDAGKLRAFGAIGATRSAALPEVPSMKELGLEADVAGDYVLLVPVKTPAPIIRQINELTAKALDGPEIAATFTKLGFDRIHETPEIMAKKFAELAVAVPRLAREAGVTPQ